MKYLIQGRCLISFNLQHFEQKTRETMKSRMPSALLTRLKERSSYLTTFDDNVIDSQYQILKNPTKPNPFPPPQIRRQVRTLIYITFTKSNVRVLLSAGLFKCII